MGQHGPCSQTVAAAASAKGGKDERSVEALSCDQVLFAAHAEDLYQRWSRGGGGFPSPVVPNDVPWAARFGAKLSSLRLGVSPGRQPLRLVEGWGAAHIEQIRLTVGPLFSPSRLSNLNPTIHDTFSFQCQPFPSASPSHSLAPPAPTPPPHPPPAAAALSLIGTSLRRLLASPPSPLLVTMGALNLIPLVILFAVVGGIGWTMYQVRAP